MTVVKNYIVPVNIEEAIGYALENKNDFKYIAGGTDLMANKFQGNELAGCLIDISQIIALKSITTTEDYLKIGALNTLDTLIKNKEIQTLFPTLQKAAQSVGSPIIRKSATIGGNILCENRCLFYNQSEWWRNSIGFCLKCEGDVCIATGGKKACFSETVSDTAPCLISMKARIEIIDEEGERILPLESIYTGDGVKPVNLNKTAIVKAVLLPLGMQFRIVFKKLRLRESLEFTSLTTSMSIDKDGNIIISMAGVDPGYVVINGDQNSNQEELIKQALKGSRAVDNDILTRGYRREMIRTFLMKSFEELKI